MYWSFDCYFFTHANMTYKIIFTDKSNSLYLKMYLLWQVLYFQYSKYKKMSVFLFDRVFLLFVSFAIQPLWPKEEYNHVIYSLVHLSVPLSPLTVSTVVHSSICAGFREEKFWRQPDDGPRPRQQAVPPGLQQSTASETGQNLAALHWWYVTFLTVLIFSFYLPWASVLYLIHYIKAWSSACLYLDRVSEQYLLKYLYIAGSMYMWGILLPAH